MNQKTKSKVRDGKKTKTASGLTSTEMNLIVNFKFFLSHFDFKCLHRFKTLHLIFFIKLNKLKKKFL